MSQYLFHVIVGHLFSMCDITVTSDQQHISRKL